VKTSGTKCERWTHRQYYNIISRFLKKGKYRQTKNKGLISANLNFSTSELCS